MSFVKVVSIFTLCVAFASPALVTWTGTAKDNQWETANNWLGGAAPVPGDSVIIATAPCDVNRSTNTGPIESLTVGASCGLTVSAPLTVTGLVASSHYSIVATRITLASSLTVASSSAIGSLFVKFGYHNGSIVIGNQLAFLPLSGCNSGSLTIDGDLLMSSNTIRILFGDPISKNFSTLTVNGVLVMNDMLLEMVVSNAGSWASLNTVVNPIKATTYTGTYSTNTIDGCSCGSPGPAECGNRYIIAYGCNANVPVPFKRKRITAVCDSYQVMDAGSTSPTPGTSCTTSGFGVLLGGSTCEASSTPPATCPPYLTGAGCSEPFCAPYTTTAGNCNSHGTCILAGTGSTCSCSAGWTGTDCSIPICSTSCGRNGNCTAPDTCTCTSAKWTGPTCSTPVCSPACGANGVCDGRNDPPTCVCNAGYTNAPVCDQVATTCPGTPLCGGSTHGTCDSTRLMCSCIGEWTGAACDLPMCNGASTNLCSGHGVCNATSTPHSCACDVGWKGSNCDVPSCPSDCSGQGTCSTVSGVPTCLCFSGWQEPDCANAVVIPTTTPDPTTFSTPSPNKTSDSAPLLTRTASPSSNKRSGMSKNFKIGLSIGLAVLAIVLIVVGVLVWKFHGRLITLCSSGEGARKLSVTSRHDPL